MGFFYGGQAVFEGVMMRGKNNAVVTVRRPDGELFTIIEKIPSIYQGWMRRTPLFRGVIALIESMVLGIQTIVQSANVSLEESEVKLSGGFLFMMLAISIGLAALLFFITPLFLTKLLTPIADNPFLFNITEGIIRLAIFVIYLKAVSLMPDIKRIFAYHGAEHKAVNALEAGAVLDVESVRKYPTAHVRCGTSFLFVVLIVAILVFSIVGVLPNLWMMVLSRIIFIPLVAALAYEFIFFSARHCNNWFIKLLLIPGLALQKLTTRPPDDSQIEVAIASLKKAVELDQAPVAVVPIQMAAPVVP